MSDLGVMSIKPSICRSPLQICCSALCSSQSQVSMKHQLSGKDDNPKKTGISGTIGFSAAPHVPRRKRRDSDTESGNETDEGDLPDFGASEESDLEIDGPRLAQWEGEEEGGDDNGSELEVETDRGEGPSKVRQANH